MNLQIFVKPKFLMKRALIVQIDGEFINLKGEDITETLPASAKGPATKVPVRGATQEDLLKIVNDPKKYGNFSKILGAKEIPAPPAKVVVKP